jgi:DNA topoisomerase-2
VFKRRGITEEAEGTESTGEYDYLLSMPLSSLTSERIVDLREDADKKEKEMLETKATTAKDLWMKDLDNLAAQL